MMILLACIIAGKASRTKNLIDMSASDGEQQLRLRNQALREAPARHASHQSKDVRDAGPIEFTNRMYQFASKKTVNLAWIVGEFYKYVVNQEYSDELIQFMHYKKGLLSSWMVETFFDGINVRLLTGDKWQSAELKINWDHIRCGSIKIPFALIRGYEFGVMNASGANMSFTLKYVKNKRGKVRELDFEMGSHGKLSGMVRMEFWLMTLRCMRSHSVTEAIFSRFKKDIVKGLTVYKWHQNETKGGGRREIRINGNKLFYSKRFGRDTYPMEFKNIVSIDLCNKAGDLLKDDEKPDAHSRVVIQCKGSKKLTFGYKNGYSFGRYRYYPKHWCAFLNMIIRPSAQSQ